MIFSSFEYLLLFLPITFVGYHLFLKFKLIIPSKIWLVASSLVFYSFYGKEYVILILFCTFMNYLLGSVIIEIKFDYLKRIVLILGLIFNLSILCYYKYTNFLIENLNFLFGFEISLKKIALPLAISFFTFQKIAYLVDCYKKRVQEYDFLNFLLFISFFPQLIAGPIIHHKDFIPQFLKNKRIFILNYKNLCLGFFLLSLGLFKKVFIADHLAAWVDVAFSISEKEIITFFPAWLASLGYSFQLYFDFSGYTDMAIGSALFFNIKLPSNFESPYKSTNIQDFWRRWHITLGQFLKDYVYIPLGGNRNSKFGTYLNLFLTFLIGGIWHGANWMFVIWGVLHGIAVIFHRIIQSSSIKINYVISMIFTFLFVNLAWVFFRSNNFGVSKQILNGMLGFNGISFSYSLNTLTKKNTILFYLTFFVALIACFLFKNSMELLKKFEPNMKFKIATSILFFIATLFLVKNSPFLYFNF